MHRAMLWLLISSVLVHQGPLAAPAEAPTPYDDPEAYQVYSAILSDGWFSSASEFVIDAETAARKMCLYPREESRTIVGPPIEDYVRHSARAWALRRIFSLNRPY